jgi:hypothetical protein
MAAAPSQSRKAKASSRTEALRLRRESNRGRAARYFSSTDDGDKDGEEKTDGGDEVEMRMGVAAVVV